MRGKKFLAWCRGEAVLLTAAVCAAVSALAVPPSAAYLGYIDLRVLCLLLCLMAVVAGLQHCGVFLVLSQRLLAGEKNVRLLQLLLVLLPFFSSMLITNDVALITFVPFTLQILELAGERRRVLPTVILQTAAANLGSMATPVGNPQNLFLCGHFHLSAGDFFSTLLPSTAVSLLALSAGALVGSRQSVCVRFPQPAAIRRPGLLAVLAALFALCLLAVFHVVHYAVVTAVVVTALLVQRMQARGWLPATRVLALRAFQLFFLALFFFNVGPASTVSLLACYVAAALPGRKWYFRLSRHARFSVTAACAVLSVIWVPVSFVVMPSITDDVAFCAIFSWCVLPLAFIRCIVSNCRFYKLAARYGL